MRDRGRRSRSAGIWGRSHSWSHCFQDGCGCIALLKLHLTRSGYATGPLFRASTNGNGRSRSHDAAHNQWEKFCGSAREAVAGLGKAGEEVALGNRGLCRVDATEGTLVPR
jgi:hypothetical protein